MQKIFPYILLLSALSISLVAASYSVYGLAKLFSGHFNAILIMAGVLEICKLIIATGLHKYYNVWPKLLNIYLSLALLVLMVITSLGIYGFLSDGYTKTSSIDKSVTRQVELIEVKKQIWEERKNDFIKEKDIITLSISELRKSLANPNQIQYIDKKTGNVITTTSSSARQSLENQLSAAISNRDEISTQLKIALDSINLYELQKVSLINNNEFNSELGPLKYVSSIIKKPMDIVVNWLMLLIIFVFDPLAIALVFAANISFKNIRTSSIKPNDENKQQETQIISDNIEVDLLNDNEVVIKDDNSKIMNILDDIDSHMKSQANNQTVSKKYKTKTVKNETTDNDIKREIKLTPNQIKDMSHEALQKYLKKQ